MRRCRTWKKWMEGLLSQQPSFAVSDDLCSLFYLSCGLIFIRRREFYRVSYLLPVGSALVSYESACLTHPPVSCWLAARLNVIIASPTNPNCRTLGRGRIVVVDPAATSYSGSRDRGINVCCPAFVSFPVFAATGAGPARSCDWRSTSTRHSE
jgi:hypothetical protein